MRNDQVDISINRGRIFYFFTIIFATLISGSGCERDDLVAIRSIETIEPEISGTTAVTGGIMTANREIELVEYGVVFNTSENPDVEDNLSPGTDLTVLMESNRYIAEFRSQIAPLAPGTTYYVRAFVTTRSGSAYGNQIILTTN